LTQDIALVLGVLAAALALLVFARLRMDVVALLVLGSLAVTGLVTPAEAVAGFSNGAVIAVWAMFIISDALNRAGIADLIGRTLLRVSGRGETRTTSVIMLVSGALSFFMNKIGVASLMLPVVVDMARRKRIPASRLLMPLSQGTLLGGLTTLVANPPNLLIAESLTRSGFESFGVLDFAPMGVPLLLLGTAFVALVARHTLPRKKPEETQRRSQRTLRMQYGLQARNVEMHVKPGCILIGRTLAESRITSAAGLVVLALQRRGRTDLMPPKQTVLEPDDTLLVQGRLDRIQEFQRWSELVIEREAPVLQSLMAEQVRLVEVTIADGSPLDMQTVAHTLFRRRYKSNLLAIRRGENVRRAALAQASLRAGDRLLLQTRADTVAELERSADFEALTEVGEQELEDVYRLQERIFIVRVPRESTLAGAPVSRGRFADAFDFRLLGLFREGELRIMPDAEEALQGGDLLVIQGDTEDLDVLRGLQELEIERDRRPSGNVLNSERLGMIEATLDPHSRLVGSAVGDIGFHEKYGLELAAVWRQNETIRTNLESLVLKLGDALLLVGPRERLLVLERDPDFLILTSLSSRTVDTRKAPIAGAIMAGVVVSVLIGWLPIGIAALLGATLMVVSRCIKMDEAYRAIDWQVIFVIAGLLPLGTAMQQTGAAELLAEQLMVVLDPMGPWWVIGGLYLLTTAVNTIIPAAPLVVLMSPIVLSASEHLGIAPQTAMMAVAMAASASFVSPLSHSAHLMVMGPGGYRFADYAKVGLPLAVLVFAAVMLLLPWFWPLTPLAVP
jgi:di/tricarboxylate transporter